MSEDAQVAFHVRPQHPLALVCLQLNVLSTTQPQTLQGSLRAPGDPPPHSSGLVTQEPTLLPPHPCLHLSLLQPVPAPDTGLDPRAPLHSNTTFPKFLSDPKPPQV